MNSVLFLTPPLGATDPGPLAAVRPETHVAGLDECEGESKTVAVVATPQRDERTTSEEFRSLKRNLLVQIDQAAETERDRIATVLIASASPGEGKTTVTLGLAMSFKHERGCRVLMIDADLGTSGLSHRLKLDGERGLLDYLADPDVDVQDIVYPTSLPGVYAVPAGGSRADGPELIGGRRMQRLLDGLHEGEQACVVLIDSGSVLSCSETTSLASHAGQILFVAAKGESRRGEIDEALAILDRDAGPLDEKRVGLVFNKADKTASPVRYAKRR